MKDAKELSHLNILIVEDQHFLRKMMAQGLRLFGAGVAEAADGLQAIKSLSGDPTLSLSPGRMKNIETDKPFVRPIPGGSYDCILSDIRMSPMNGLELLKTIRVGYGPIPRDLPVVLMSAHSDLSTLSTAVKLDASGFLAKPASLKLAVGRIVRAITKKMPIKEVLDYKNCIVDEEVWKGIRSDVSRFADENLPSVRADDLVHEEASMQTLAWTDLKEGDVVAENIMVSDKHVGVYAGTRVTLALIWAMSDLVEDGILPMSVKIFSRVEVAA